MKVMFISRTVLCSTSLVMTVCIAVDSEAEPLGRRPAVVIQSEASVLGPRYRLGDIARISADDEDSQKLADRLSAIDLGMSPSPGEKTNVQGTMLLGAIEASGLARDSFRYSIPQSLSIVRPGRLLNEGEVSTAVRESIVNEGIPGLEVRDVRFTGRYSVPLGPLQITSERLGEITAGKLPMRVKVAAAGDSIVEFIATATVNDWRMVPVLRRPMDRGSLVRSEDLELMRVNLLTQAPDALLTIEQVVGKKTKSRAIPGEVLRDSTTETPPLVNRGRSVVIVYEIAGLRATATGTALDDGQVGQDIRVRNENSKKVLRAKILTAEEVKVEAI